jgi:hypothetical protein
MTLPASATTPSLGAILQNLQNVAYGAKSQAQNAVITMQTGSINTTFVFQMLDQLNGIIGLLNSVSGITGLNTYATAQCPGYVGTLTTDITAVVNAAQAVINWTVANFPVDAQGFLQAFKLNADGSRAPASFTPAQTTGLVTVLQAFIATIG